MTAVAIIACILLILALTTVFYAAHAPGTVMVKTAIAAAGFVVLTIALYLIGALGV